MSTAYTDHFKKKWNFGVGINHYNNSVDRKYLPILQNLQSTGKSSNAVQGGKDKFYFFFHFWNILLDWLVTEVIRNIGIVNWK